MGRTRRSWTSDEVLKLISLFEAEREKLSDVLNSLPIPIILLSEGLEVAFANPAAEERAGSMVIAGMVSQPQFRDAALAVLNTGGAKQVRPAGMPGNWQCSLTRIGRERDGVAVVLTEEAAPSGPPARTLETFAYDAPVPMFVYEAGGKLTFANRALEQLTGFAQRELLAMEIGDLLKTGAAMPGGGETGRGVHLLQTVGNQTVRVRATMSRSHRAGQAHTFIGVLQSLEEDPGMTPDVRRMESLERMAGEVAHRLNNLLTVILSYSELISARFGSVETLREDVGRIAEAGSGAAQLTSKLLTFSRGRPQQTGPVNVESALEEMKGILEGVLGPRTRLRLRLDSPGALIHSNRTEIESLILALVENARDAIGDGSGEVTIRTTFITPWDAESGHLFSGLQLDPSRHICISVSDTGPGIPPEILPRIFEPFFSTKEHGEGLGLAVAYGIAQRLGGNIGVEPAPSGGAAFLVCVPDMQPQGPA